MFRVIIDGSVNRTFELFSDAFSYFWSTLLRMVREDAITLRQIESDSWIELIIHEQKYILHIYALRHLAKQTKIINEQGIINRNTKEPIFEIIETAFKDTHHSSLSN